IIKGSISKEHVHMLVSCPPNISVSQMMQYLKERSSKKLQEEFSELKRKYWGQHIWTTGYFCRTVGTVTNEMIKEYIENQTDDTEEVFKLIK
ncbi:MAG: IS200/IS605 family transposase, partial [Erysipelotrichaceae bacterium]|nr:IS200/IS605 family transposase [Erysipelotrichaceae bacterium]